MLAFYCPICWLLGRQDYYHVVVITINRALIFFNVLIVCLCTIGASKAYVNKNMANQHHWNEAKKMFQP